jgi:endoglucanase
MGSGRVRGWRWPTAFVGVTGAICVSLLGVTPSRAANVPLSISIVGNHFVNGSGHTIRLLGVNHTSAEYGCVDGFGYDDGHFDAADAAAIASWGADAVRIPLNEDCWLGINGQPNSNEGADPPLTKDGYQQQITRYVADLNAHGIYAILDLHWTAPGAQVALEQQPMPDQDHSPAFWTAVASTFKNNPAVVFDLFNEPFDPTDARSGVDQDLNDKVTWNCWDTGTENGLDGGAPCYTAAYDENNAETTTYQVAGLQTLLTAVRATGATQPVLAGGLDFANDIGESDHGNEWMHHAPNDPLNQEAASFHNYMGEGCDNATCWKQTIAPIAKHVPVVTGEFDEDNFDEPNCQNKTPSMFDARYMKWADSAGVSYLAWGWIVESQSEQNADGCSAFSLITNYSDYTPARPNGVAIRDHLRALKDPPPIRLTKFSASVSSSGKSVGFRLRSSQSCAGRLTGETVHSYVAAHGKPRRVPLGAVRFALRADKTRAVVIELSKPARHLLAAKHSLRVRITVILTGSHHRRTIVHLVLTLR